MLCALSTCLFLIYYYKHQTLYIFVQILIVILKTSEIQVYRYKAYFTVYINRSNKISILFKAFICKRSPLSFIRIYVSIFRMIKQILTPKHS
jgi:hypothetical protein